MWLRTLPEYVKYPRYDLPTAAELCRCCGAVLLRYGSKFSVGFCGGCYDLVRSFNPDQGSYAVDVGRHIHGRPSSSNHLSRVGPAFATRSRVGGPGSSGSRNGRAW